MPHEKNFMPKLEGENKRPIEETGQKIEINRSELEEFLNEVEDSIRKIEEGLEEEGLKEMKAALNKGKNLTGREIENSLNEEEENILNDAGIN